MLNLLYNRLIQRLNHQELRFQFQNKRITEPLSAIYVIPDHTHALCNMLGDGLTLAMLLIFGKNVCKKKVK